MPFAARLPSSATDIERQAAVFATARNQDFGLVEFTVGDIASAFEQIAPAAGAHLEINS